MARKKGKGQYRILEEIKTQLILQAKRWGREDHYSPLKLADMEMEQCRKILSDLLSEKANIEYQAEATLENRREAKIKLDKLNGYIRKAEHTIQKHEKNINTCIEKMAGDKNKIKRAADLIRGKELCSRLA